jgi:hypothetical protein
MPGFFPGRPGGEHDEPLLDMILERRLIPPGAPPELHGLAHMLATVAGPAEPGDLAGQAAAQAAFARLASPPGASPAALRSARRSLSERPARGRLPIAVALAAAAAGLGSTAAAYADVLPSPIQHFAHVAIRAPEPLRDIVPSTGVVTSSPTPSHPDHAASGSAGEHSGTSSDPVVSGQANPGQLWNHGWRVGSVPPDLSSCPPGQGQDQGQGNDQGQDRGVGPSQNPAAPSPPPNPVKSGSAQGSDGSGQAQRTASLPSSKTACSESTIPTKAAHARGQ